MQYEIYFIIGLMLVAFFYASVGHGGASGYLALMALFGFVPDSIRFNALTMNMFVSGIAFISYYRAGFFRWKLIMPFLISSVPAAYLGAQISINPTLYKILLGIFLLIAVFRLLFVRNMKIKPMHDLPFFLALVIGLVLGLISGIIGIGGGILLSPILILAGFATTKEASAVSALFILLNSASGLAGLASQFINFQPHLIYYIAAVMGAGFVGSAIGSQTLSEYKLRIVLSVVLLAASMKLFFF
ncbi:MAG: sulfite exporter TauE/SafE family protein [Bacteroidales bacterium]|nr:sulfite exporter TauE/SafE family protein [Bacteroidales bacterium]